MASGHQQSDKVSKSRKPSSRKLWAVIGGHGQLQLVLPLSRREVLGMLRLAAPALVDALAVARQRAEDSTSKDSQNS